jgi:hypothetical protein
VASLSMKVVTVVVKQRRASCVERSDLYTDINLSWAKLNHLAIAFNLVSQSDSMKLFNNMQAKGFCTMRHKSSDDNWLALVTTLFTWLSNRNLLSKRTSKYLTLSQKSIFTPFNSRARLWGFICLVYLHLFRLGWIKE